MACQVKLHSKQSSLVFYITSLYLFMKFVNNLKAIKSSSLQSMTRQRVLWITCLLHLFCHFHLILIPVDSVALISFSCIFLSPFVCSFYSSHCFCFFSIFNHHLSTGSMPSFTLDIFVFCPS